MRISKAQIEAVKQSSDIVSVVRSRGIKLKKKGKNYVALCPFHKEKTPSFTVDPVKQLYNCFGCPNNGKGSTGGNVIGFTAKIDNISFPEAVKRLSNGKGLQACKLAGRQAKKQKENDHEPAASNQQQATRTPRLQKLLARVIDFYHTTFTENDRGLKYLAEKRKITDKDIFRDFKVGYSNGTLLKTLPDDGEIIDSLKTIGVLNNKGNEHFYGSVTFPIYDLSGSITGIYGRKIRDQQVNHLYLSGPRNGVFNRQAAKLHDEIILTESIIDSLSLYNAGFKNTIPCYGTNGLTSDHLTLFKRYNVKTIYLCFDADDAGRYAAAAIAPRLADLDITVYSVSLPEKHDINSFFSSFANAPDEFKKLLDRANSVTTPLIPSHQGRGEKDTCRKTEQGFIVAYRDREYEIMGISRTETKLKATIKGIRIYEGKRQLHVDTVDFYSFRSRRLIICGLMELFGQGEGEINEDINSIMECIENLIKKDKGQKNDKDKIKEEITEADKKEALKLLKTPDMFNEIITDFETIGYTGDDTNKLLCYISAISRKMEEPLSVMIQSRSAAGKSFLQDTVLSLIPEDDFVKYTRLTDQSLFYKDRYSLVHKILAIEEMDGMNGAIYSIRSIQSSKKITVAYTGKDAATGKMKTEENTVEGPIMVFITTTQVDIDGETASRYIFISLDESQEMTEKILEKQREKHTMEGLINKLNAKRIIKKHHAVNQLLKPLYVINPYCKLLTFTSKSLRARREHTKYQNLILAIAYLFQYQREIKRMQHDGREIEYITVKISDIEKANIIADEVLGISLDELSPPSKRLLLLIQEMVMKVCKEKKITPKEYHFTRREIREYTGWSDFQIRIHIKELEELEYIYSVIGKRGKEYVYELIYTGDDKGKRALLGQIDIEELKQKAKKTGLPVD